jgi:hypothetical protein
MREVFFDHSWYPVATLSKVRNIQNSKHCLSRPSKLSIVPKIEKAKPIRYIIQCERLVSTTNLFKLWKERGYRSYSRESYLLR